MHRAETRNGVGAVPPKLPPAICFRVTRFCNARCVFCLAPSDWVEPAEDTLIHRLDWLLSRGVPILVPRVRKICDLF